MSIDPIISNEISGRSGSRHCNCAYCGYGLSLRSCGNCKHTFTDTVIEPGWSMPLPAKVIENLQASDFVFTMDPNIGLMLEKEIYRKN